MISRVVTLTGEAKLGSHVDVAFFIYRRTFEIRLLAIDITSRPGGSTIGTSRFAGLSPHPMIHALLVDVVPASGLAVHNRFFARLELRVADWALAFDRLPVSIATVSFPVSCRDGWSILE